MDNMDENIKRHVAGATVTHISKFSTLKVIENHEELSKVFINKYVKPFYLAHPDSESFKKSYFLIKDEISKETISTLLGDFDWRPRKVGAYFTAIKNFKEFEDNIGRLLLRSDVCYAGITYCLTLASFGTKKSISYIQEYLEYYLKQFNLDFDQPYAMAALAYLGKIKNEDLVSPFMDKWKIYISKDPVGNLEQTISIFEKQMGIIDSFKLESGS